MEQNQEHRILPEQNDDLLQGGCTKQKARIVIDIDNSKYAHSFPKNESIHQIALTKAVELIEVLTHKADKIATDDDDNDFAPIETHDAIAVFGQRGVGKTSFLRSVAKIVDIRNRNVIVLPLIDPTLIEEKGHVFLLVLSLINCKVEQKLLEDELKPNSPAYNRRSEWKLLLERLSKGLPSLDNLGVGYDNPSWQDATYIMNKGLANVASAHNLQRDFRILVRKALDILGSKKALLLIFDDIDVSFQRGWPVLETIRKYFTIPEVITIISGNEKLYSKNVRKTQWQNFGKALLKNEADGNSNEKKRYNALVDELVEQYMQKLFKADHRVQLHSLLTYVDQNSDSNEYVVRDKQDDSLLSEKYNSILKNHGISLKWVQTLCKEFFLSMPVRSQIQFLIDNRNGSEGMGIDAFRLRMLDYGIDTDRLYVNTITSEILHSLIDKKVAEVSYQLLPNMDDYGQNAALLGLNLSFSYFLKRNPKLIFDYLLRIGYCRNMTEYLGYKDDGKKANVDDMCDYGNMFRERTYRDYIGNAIAYAVGRDKPRLVGQLRVIGPKTKTRSEVKIDAIKNIEDGKQKIIAWLPFCKLKYSTKNESRYYYSIYMLLASIGMVVSSEVEEDIRQALWNCLMERDYVIAKDQEKEKSDDNDELEEDAMDKGVDDAILDDFSKELYIWKEQIKPFACSAHLLGRISTRTYNAMENVMKRKYGSKLGAMMELFVCSFLNACLIEESRELFGVVKGVKPNNVRTDRKVYDENLQAFKNEQDIEKLPLTNLFIKCPILAPFVDEDCELFKTLDKITRYDIYGINPIGGNDEVPIEQNVDNTNDVVNEGDAQIENNSNFTSDNNGNA